MSIQTLTLYGATGFTGTLAARALWDELRKPEYQPIARLCLAGRNAGKLHALRESLGPDAVQAITIHVADSSDAESLDSLTRQSDLVLSAAGPFSLHSPRLIQACVRNACHYLDITGETPFIRSMIDQHHLGAQTARVKIIPFCGFDSIPSDLGFRAIHAEWAQRYPDTPCEKVTALFSVRGGFNGGTLATALLMARSGESKRVESDLQLLSPSHSTTDQPPAAPDWKDERFFPVVKTWGAPFFMAPINTRVVRRSQLLSSELSLPVPSASYSTCLYEEGMRVKSRFQGRIVWKTQSVFARVTQSRIGLSLLETLVPAPGSGPSEKAQKNGLTHVHYLAEGKDGRSLQGRLHWDGDPGNSFTIFAFTQAAFCLLKGEISESHQREFGVLTPSVAFGDALWKRLQNNGMSWSI